MIWITGSEGMLGRELCSLLEEKGIGTIKTDREIDITDLNALGSFVNGKTIEWIINCAGYTAVDKAEDEKELCFRLNSKGPENLAITATKTNANLIHISTDYVFDGKSMTDYREDDEVNPQSVYGNSKLEGEKEVLKNSQKSIILRTAWLYGRHGANFVHTMLKLMKTKEEIGVVSDQWGAPTWTSDLSACILAIIKKENPVYGIFHASGKGRTNWHEFAEEIQKFAYQKGIIEKKIKIKQLKTEEYPVKAKRPMYSLLGKEKLENTYGFIFPHWKESLEQFLEETKKGGL